MSSAKPFWVLATQNPKKAKELVALTDARVAVKTLADLGLSELEIIEDGETFQDNAEIKVRTVWRALRATSLEPLPDWVIADDSGLCVDALDGGPGVRSARFALDAGCGEGDEANNDLLLDRLRPHAGADERRAHFACALCAISPEGRLARFYGEVHGTIGHERVGQGGFGYDPLFYPDEYPSQTTAELSPAEKHAISHRGKAFRDLASVLLSE